MEYKSYQHVEKFGTDEVQGIEIGTCYCFPKVDGTNASIWRDDTGNIRTGSRTRDLCIEGANDNAGFREAVKTQEQFEGIKRALQSGLVHRFYGEWLVPHTVKTYRESAWRVFYVFDVTIARVNEDGTIWEEYLDYPTYKALCEDYKINYIPCISIIKNGTYENFIHVTTQNNYLIEDGKGTGEGIVIKNYEYKNKWGRVTWAKIVTSEFKEEFHKVMGPNERENKLVEEDIANDFCTQTLIDKTYAKIAIDGWSSKHIPRLLETVYHDLVVEEIYTILKKMSFPTINFKTLRVFVIQKIKQLRPDLF